MYHFDVPTVHTDSGWNSLADQVVTEDKKMHGSDVIYTNARIHGPTNGTKAEDQMRLVKDLSGGGTLASVGAEIGPELVVVCSLYMGRSPAGYKVFLRKYVRSAYLPTSAPSGAQAQRTALGSTAKAIYQTPLQNLKNITVGGGANALCTPKGEHIPVGNDWAVSDYVHTRQMRKGRKERRA